MSRPSLSLPATRSNSRVSCLLLAVEGVLHTQSSRNALSQSVLRAENTQFTLHTEPRLTKSCLLCPSRACNHNGEFCKWIACETLAVGEGKHDVTVTGSRRSIDGLERETHRAKMPSLTVVHTVAGILIGKRQSFLASPQTKGDFAPPCQRRIALVARPPRPPHNDDGHRFDRAAFDRSSRVGPGRANPAGLLHHSHSREGLGLQGTSSSLCQGDGRRKGHPGLSIPGAVPRNCALKLVPFPRAFLCRPGAPSSIIKSQRQSNSNQLRDVVPSQTQQNLDRFNRNALWSR